MKQGDIVIWDCINTDNGSAWFWKIKPPFQNFKIVCYWRIKQLKQPTTIQYTFDNPKGKIKLP